MKRLLINNKLLDSKEYCYHGSTTKQNCAFCGAKESIYKDIMKNAFCIRCGKKTDF